MHPYQLILEQLFQEVEQAVNPKMNGYQARELLLERLATCKELPEAIRAPLISRVLASFQATPSC